MDISLGDIAAKFRDKIPDVTNMKTFTGKGKNEGKVLVRLYVLGNMSIDITIDPVEMLKNPGYFDGIFENVMNALEEARRNHQEITRIEHGLRSA